MKLLAFFAFLQIHAVVYANQSSLFTVRRGYRYNLTSSLGLARRWSKVECAAACDEETSCVSLNAHRLDSGQWQCEMFDDYTGNVELLIEDKQSVYTCKYSYIYNAKIKLRI